MRDRGWCGDRGAGRSRGGWDAWGFWGFGPFPGGRRSGGRVFGQGDLKYVILKLLAEKPRHGYEIIRELEDRFGGAYAPSAGTVYPTLAMLEDLGYARAVPEEGGRKVYEITDAGRNYLAQHQDVVTEIFDRIRSLGDFLMGDAMLDVHRGVRRVATEAYTQARRFQGDPAALGALAAALDAAARAIADLRPMAPPGGMPETPFPSPASGG